MPRALLACVMTGLLLLTGCADTTRSSPVEPVEQRPAALLDGTVLTLRLDGHTGTQPPTLQLLGPDDEPWSEIVTAAAPPLVEGGAVTFKADLKNRLEGRLVEEVRYRWQLADGSIRDGSLLYRPPAFPDIPWQVLRTENLVVFTAVPLAERETGQWEEMLRNISTWAGMKRERKLVIWVLPDYTTMQKLWNMPAYLTPGGVWHHDWQRLVMVTAERSDRQSLLVAHEMGHAVAPHSRVIWFREGFASLIEAKQARAMGLTPDIWYGTGYWLQRLQLIAQERTVNPAEVVLDMNRMDNPYSIGTAIWLYVQRHHGEEGVHRFLREGSLPAGPEPVLEAMFGKPLQAIWADWNTYLKDPALMEDWKNA